MRVLSNVRNHIKHLSNMVQLCLIANNDEMAYVITRELVHYAKVKYHIV